MGGIVELAIPAGVLARLAEDPPAAWAGVITDIAAQYQQAPVDDRADRTDRSDVTDRAGGADRTGRADGVDRADVLDRHPSRRFPGRALRRHIQIRDRTCSAPNCRRPAAPSDQDHTTDYRLPTRRHHHPRRTRTGLPTRPPTQTPRRLDRHPTQPGHFTWTSPLGRVYRTRGERITDPEPDPPEEDPPPF